MFNFIRNHQIVLQSGFLRYMSCQHPLLLPPAIFLRGSRPIYSKHNLDPITFLLKLFQWLPTALRIKSKFFNIACILWPLALYLATASPSHYPLMFGLQLLLIRFHSLHMKLFPSLGLLYTWSFSLNSPHSLICPFAYLFLKFQFKSYFLRDFLCR